MKKILKNIISNNNFLSLFGNMIFAVFGFASIFILARSFGKDMFGEWVMYITAVSFVEMARIGLTRTAVVKFLAGAQSDDEGHEIIGSGWVIEIALTIVFIILVYSSYLIFPTAISESGFRLFFIWYPLMAILVTPFNNSLTILQAKQKFGSIISLRLVSMGSFVLFIIVNYFFLKLSVRYIVFAHIGSNALASIFGIIMGWSGMVQLFNARKKRILELLNFGKFSLGTLIGSNLLKSSDTILLGIMMTKADAAIYAIPIKLIEVLEIPLRSFIAVALPRMSRESRLGNKEEVKN
ncbi:MAG: oligosaccharide flippase family protein, partial [Bacteroidota bacterium]|nr:oligosaccharide flippase family protein [Bacteroidota bacterium]